jgi:hypothetical protein
MSRRNMMLNLVFTEKAIKNNFPNDDYRLLEYDGM